MHDGISYDPIQGQGQGHETLKVRNSSIFKVCLLCHFHDNNTVAWIWCGFCQVCPVCAVLPSGDPNHVTDDLGAHIALVHRLTTTDFISFVTLM